MDLKPNPKHVRNPLPEVELHAVGESVIRHQEIPLIWNVQKMIWDGHCRRAGVMLINPDCELEGIETDEPLDASELQLITDVFKKNLGCYERYCIMRQWMADHPGATHQQLAERIGGDQSMVSRYLALATVHPSGTGGGQGRKARHHRLGGDLEGQRTGSA